MAERDFGSGRTANHDPGASPVARLSLTFFGAVFVLLSVGAAVGCVSVLFDGYPLLPLPFPGTPADAASFLFSLLIALFLSTMFMTTCAPILEYAMKRRFDLPEGEGIVFVRSGPAARGLPFSLLSSSGVVRWPWYILCGIGLPFSLVVTVMVAIQERGAITGQLYSSVHGFDISLLIPMFLLIPAQQLGAGYIAGAFRAAGSEWCRTDPDGALQRAMLVALFAGLHNVVSLLIVFWWFVGLLASPLGGALALTLGFWLLLLGLSIVSYLAGVRAETWVARSAAAPKETT